MDSSTQVPESESPSSAISEGDKPTPRWLHRLILVTAVLSFIGMLHGGGVTSTDSAMVDKSWPTFEGSWLPDFGRMFENPYLFLEHNHRLIMASVGFLIILSAFFLFRIEGHRRAVRIVGLVAAALVAIVGVLGGLTVLLGKSPPVSVIHVAIAMMVVLSVWSLVVVTGKSWFAERETRDPVQTKRLLGVCSAALAAIYIQVVLGAVPRHATQEFGGRTMVLIGDVIHILWAFIVFGTVILAYLEVGRGYRKIGRVLRPSLLLVFLVVGQVALGIVTFMEQPKEPPRQTDLRGGGQVQNEDEQKANAVAGEVLAANSESPAIAAKKEFDYERPSTSHVVTASTHQAVGFLMLIAALFLTLRVARIHDLSRRAAGLAAGVSGEGGRVDDVQESA